MSHAILVSAQGLRFYGAAREFWRDKGHELLLEGPYETGKTLVALTKLHALLCKYPNCRALMTRMTYKSLVNSAIVTFEKKVLPYPPDHEKSAIHKFGGEKPEFYDYPNGSRLVCTGLDNSSNVQAILSAEYDYIYINQLEEVPLGTYENLVGRATGRAGNAPYPQVMADCNPGPPNHWILGRQRLKKFQQRHENNPTLFAQDTGKITERGERTLAILDGLTGLRYKRGRLGLWVSAEGQVYDTFDPLVHIINPFPIPRSWRRFRAIDFGYTNPFVCQWWAVDEDGRMYLYREIYMTRRTVAVHADEIFRLEAGLPKEMWKNLPREVKWELSSVGERINSSISDHDAEDRATLHENGIFTLAAKKGIRRGNQIVQERLKVQGDGRPRLMVMRDALVEADRELYKDRPGDSGPCCTEHEFLEYIYPPGVDGKSNKEEPMDKNNHGMDAMYYMAVALETGLADTKSIEFW